MLTTTVSIVVCHDRPLVREGLHKLLDAEPGIDVVGATDSVTEAVVLAQEYRPQVILTGLTLDGGSGIDLIARVDREDLEPAPHFVVYATIGGHDLLTAFLRAGVSGVLADDASREEMVLAVRVAARGQTILGPGVADRLLAWFRETAARSTVALSEPAVASLTPREREVLLLTANGLSIDEIAHRLFIGVTTVRTHLYRVRTKLQVKDRAQLVSLAYRTGLMLPS